MNFLNWIDVGFIANELLAAIIIFVVLYSLLPFLMKRVDRIWKYIRDDNAAMSIWDGVITESGVWAG